MTSPPTSTAGQKRIDKLGNEYVYESRDGEQVWVWTQNRQIAVKRSDWESWVVTLHGKQEGFDL